MLLSNPLKLKEGPFISLCSVVKYNIQDNFDAVCMKLADQSLEFCSFTVVFIGRRIATVRREETDRIVSPAFQKLCSVYGSCIHGFIKFKIGISSTALIPSSLR